MLSDLSLIFQSFRQQPSKPLESPQNEVLGFALTQLALSHSVSMQMMGVLLHENSGRQDVISKSKRKSSAFLVRLRPDLWSVIGDAFHVPAFVFVAFLLIGSAQREKTWRKIKLFASEDPGARNQKTKSRSHNWFLNPNSITIHHNAPKTSKDYEGRPFNHLNLKSSKLQGPQPYVAELRALFTQTVRLSELHVNVAFASI